MSLEGETRQLVSQIGTSLDGLKEAVGELTQHQAKQLRRTRRALRWTVAGLVVDLLLTAAGGGLYAQVRGNTDRLRVVDDRVSTQALCPLYEVFLRSYNPNSPSAQADPAGYRHSFDVIEAGARALGCTRTVRGR